VTDSSSVPTVFVTGMPRSGTTLLMVMLDAHLNGTMPRGRVVQAMLDRWYKGVEDERHLEQFLSDLYESDYLNRPPRFDRTVLEQRLTEKLPLSFESLLRTINCYDAYLDDKTLSFWGEKTSALIWDWNRLKTIFNDPYLIILIRDGRAIMSSTLAMYSVNNEVDILGFQHHWADTYNKFCCEAGRLANDSRVKAVRYEDLISDPSGTLEELCRFVGIEFDDDMLNYFLKHDRFASDPHKEIHKLVYHPPVTDRKDRWLMEMRPSLSRITDAHTRKSLEFWKYPELPPALKRPNLVVWMETGYYLFCFKIFMVLVYRCGLLRNNDIVRFFGRRIGFVRED
tara:strand:- start:1435 stop:2454 length:1020 start_codon:yes stop_codon:yes gene_type:complete